MWGVEGVNRAVASNLSRILPESMQRLRARSAGIPGYEAGDIPDVAAIYPTVVEFASIDKYPCLMLSPLETQGRFETRSLGSDGVSEEYTFSYKVRVLIYVMGSSYDSTELLAQRLTVAVREALLLDKRYGDLEGGNGGQLDPSQVRESYAETAGPAPFLSASYVEIVIKSTESMDSLRGEVPVSGVNSTVGLLSPIPIITPGLP